MADPGFPAQHTTATMTTTETHVSPQIRYDHSYLRTVPGIIKLVCIVLNLIGFICIEVSAFSYHSRGSFFNSVAMTGFWFTGIMLLLYLFHVLEKFYKLPWLHIEMVFCAIWTLLYALAAGLAAAMGLEAYTAAAFFGFCAMVAYGYDAFLKYKAVQSGQIAQGTRQQTTVQQTVPA